MNTVTEFRTELGVILARDIEFLSASDSQRHSDPFQEVLKVAGQLFLTFVVSAGTVAAKGAAQSAGQKVGDWLKRRRERVRRAPDDNQAQLAEMAEADRVIRGTLPRLDPKAVENAFEAGTQAVLNDLKGRNYPPDIATELAEEFATAVKKRLAAPRRKGASRDSRGGEKALASPKTSRGSKRSKVRRPTRPR